MDPQQPLPGNLPGNSPAIGNPAGQLTYSVAEAAVLLQLPERTLRERIRRGKLPAIREGHSYRIPAIVVSDLKAAPTQNPGTPATAPAIAGPSATLPGNADHEQEQLREQLQHSREEIQFLRSQLDHSRQAEEQLRVLLLREKENLERVTLALANVTERSALPTGEPAPTETETSHRPWWKWWPR